MRVEAEDIRTGLRHHCCSAYLTFVAVFPSMLASRAQGAAEVGWGGHGGSLGGSVDAVDSALKGDVMHPGKDEMVVMVALMVG